MSDDIVIEALWVPEPAIEADGEEEPRVVILRVEKVLLLIMLPRCLFLSWKLSSGCCLHEKAYGQIICTRSIL